jgi:hypothetical protein
MNAEFKLKSLEQCQLTLGLEALQLILQSLIDASRPIAGQSQGPGLITFNDTEEYKLALTIYRQVHAAGVEDEYMNVIFEKELEL